MKKIISQGQDFKSFEVDFDQARAILDTMGEGFKNELVDKIESGDFKNEEKSEVFNTVTPSLFFAIDCILISL